MTDFPFLVYNCRVNFNDMVVNKNEYLTFLLLGETGVGKSTFINSVINYVTYLTLDAASESESSPLSLIPASFSHIDEFCESHKIEYGESNSNEVFLPGQSSTQGCRVYRFEVNDLGVQIIDTAGICDTRGVEQDRLNMENLLSFLNTNFDVIHGIGILMKPDEIRSTIGFRFCLQTLLSHLHKSAANNLVFCFTNCQSTFFKIKTEEILRKILSDIQDSTGIIVPFKYKENVFKFENNAFEYLCTIKQDPLFKDDFDEDQMEAIYKGWHRSTQETLRLFDFVKSKEPHLVAQTISIGKCRHLIYNLTRPLCDIEVIIQTNIKLIEDQSLIIEANKHNVEELKKALFVPYKDMEPRELGFPRTVCTSLGCIEAVNGKIDYKTHCHKKCYLDGVQTEVTNNAALLMCAAMDRHTGDCNNCGCSW